MAKSPNTSDFIIILRGLSKLGSTALELTGKDLNKTWMNSSFKPLLENTVKSCQENIKNPSVLQKDLFATTKETGERISVVGKSIQAYIRVLQGSELPSSYEKFENDQLVRGITENEESDQLKSDLNVAEQFPAASVVNDFSNMASKAKIDITEKFKDLEPMLEVPGQRSSISDEQLEAINQKLQQIQGSEHIQDFSLQEEIHTLNDSSSKLNDSVSSFKSNIKSDSIGEFINKEAFKPKFMPSKPHMPSLKSPRLLGRKPLAKEKAQSLLSSESQARKVPQSRLGRMVSFGGLAARLGAGTLAEMTRRSLGYKNQMDTGAILDSSPFLTEANAKRIVDTLCKVRGAALKLGQMLSIQDNSLINPMLLKMFDRVRQSADFMPTWQLERTLVKEFGPEWRSRIASFEDKPFAAASIGQVHQAILHDGRPVAMKIQYPGVAEGIESDINNLISTLNVAKILPDGLFVDSVIEVAKRELRWECDYEREKACTERFKELMAPYPEYYVPDVIEELSSKQVFTTELVEGIAVDKCVSLDQETRNYISRLVLQLCLKELFEFGFMQTDPNWSNFLYNQETRQVVLLDFGACRQFSKEFVDKYIKVIQGAAMKDREQVSQYSKELGFLTGYESKVMMNAHVDAVMILGKPFQSEEVFDFGAQETTKRIQKLVPVMLSERMCPPPEESYSLHRKMSGAFLLASKLKAKINCKSLFDDLWNSYEFGGSWDSGPDLNNWVTKP